MWGGVRSTEGRDFVRHRTWANRRERPFLSVPDLGLEPKFPKFCPSPDLASQGIIMGPGPARGMEVGKLAGV